MLRSRVIALSAAALLGCNGITGVSDLRVVGEGGASGNGGAAVTGAIGANGSTVTTGATPTSATTTAAMASVGASGAGGGATASTGAGGAATAAATTAAATTAAATTVAATTATAAAVTAAAVTAAATGGGGTDPAQTCVDFINQKRATLSLAAYTRWTSNEMCTDGQAQADSAIGVPHSAFGTCGEFAQNECPGWPGPPEAMIDNCLQMMWDEGPGSDFSTHGHYINMSSTQYSQVSCGFYVLPSGSVWATQDFR